MNFNELIAHAEAAALAHEVAYAAWVKAGCPTGERPELADSVAGPVTLWCSCGNLNGRSATKFRYNFKVNGKRANAAAAEAALA